MIGESSTTVDGDFPGWPEGLPQSRASRVVFQDCAVVKADAQKWAVGFRGPCLMTQNWYPNGGQYPEGARDPDWDALRISGQIEPATGELVPGTREMNIALVDEDPDEERHSPADHGLTCLYV